MIKKIFIFVFGLILIMLIGCTKKTSVSTNASLKTTLKKSETIAKTLEKETPTIKYIDLFLNNKIKKINPKETDPYITIEKDTFTMGETIQVACYNCGEKDWVGLYPYGGYPQDMNSLNFETISDGKATLSTMQYKNETRYILYLCQNDGYEVLDYKEITILNKSTKDYKVKDASYEYKDGVISLTITPPTTRPISYEIYWAKDDMRLEGYSYLKAFNQASTGAFTITFDKYLVMPDEANGLEIHVVNGCSTSVFLSVDEGPKVTSNYLYSFNVLSDIHIQTFDIKPNHVEHLQNALNDIYNYNSNSKFLVSVGDQADTGAIRDYECVTGLFNIYKEASNVPVYYLLGNHEYMYSTTYDNQIKIFKKYANTSDIFYTEVLEGSTLIFMGSDVKSTEGGINEERLDWLKEELDKADKTKPIYIFLHQPLIGTTAGSYEGQNWYGINNLGKKIKALLAGYKNTFLFTGHTHWEMESKNNIQVNEGATTYINCASVGYLWNDDNTGEPGSEGYFIDVYEDYLLIRGREFVKGEWLAYATYCVPLDFN